LDVLLREELIEKISKYFKLVDSEAEKVFDDIFAEIMEGVKKNKVVDLDNFGEFIIKYNGQGKSVEFLAKQPLDDEVNNSLAATSVPVEYKQIQPQEGSIEEELKRKREAILNKLTGGGQEIRTGDISTPEEPKKINGTESKTDEIDSESKKSFSDYFSTVSQETTQQVPTEEPREEERVIPANVVELHEEIVNKIPEKETVSEMGSMSGYYTQQVAAEQRTIGRPYYIWYKDSEPSPQETQSLSVEYELLYQAQKEAEYRSKLKIYVTTFILFFSFVLILLIFSPLIYKVFFTPQETPVESIQESPADETAQENTTTENQPPVTNTQTEQSEQQTSSQQNVTQIENTETQPAQTEVQQQAPQTNTQEQPTQTQTTETPAPTSLVGLTKNSLGWTDEKYRVIYILLDNNKYTIQESAWDSEAKANKRVRTVQSLNISGLTGSIIKADLADKGTWYRTRFGEFSSIEEARKKAIELRNKEGMRIAMLLHFLFFT
jgi:nucleoid DNA-binding protein